MLIIVRRLTHKTALGPELAQEPGDQASLITQSKRSKSLIVSDQAYEKSEAGFKTLFMADRVQSIPIHIEVRMADRRGKQPSDTAKEEV